MELSGDNAEPTSVVNSDFASKKVSSDVANAGCSLDAFSSQCTTANLLQGATVTRSEVHRLRPALEWVPGSVSGMYNAMKRPNAA